MTCTSFVDESREVNNQIHISRNEAPSGAELCSPGREPWVCEENDRSPGGATLGSERGFFVCRTYGAWCCLSTPSADALRFASLRPARSPALVISRLRRWGHHRPNPSLFRTRSQHTIDRLRSFVVRGLPCFAPRITSGAAATPCSCRFHATPRFAVSRKKAVWNWGAARPAPRCPRGLACA
jgi:hypothetical protein